MESARELADVLGTTVAVALDDVIEGLGAGESVNQPALGRALATVRTHAEVLDGVDSTRLKRWPRISMPTLCIGRPLSAT